MASAPAPAVVAGAHSLWPLVNAYRVRGHTHARLDPLRLRESQPDPDLDPATYGFGEADLDRPIYLYFGLGLETATLREILATTREAYYAKCRKRYSGLCGPQRRAKRLKPPNRKGREISKLRKSQ